MGEDEGGAVAEAAADENDGGELAGAGAAEADGEPVEGPEQAAGHGLGHSQSPRAPLAGTGSGSGWTLTNCQA